MIPEDDSFSLSIPRKLTSFRVKELLFDYHLGTLDESTQKAVAEFLVHDVECKTELEKIKRADSYCFQISKIYVTQDLEQQVLDSTTYWSLYAKKLNIKNWPSSVALFAESLAVGMLIFFLLNYIPWKSVRDWWKVSFDSVQIAHNSGKDADFDPTSFTSKRPSTNHIEGPVTITKNDSDLDANGLKNLPDRSDRVASQNDSMTDSKRTIISAADTAADTANGPDATTAKKPEENVITVTAPDSASNVDLKSGTGSSSKKNNKNDLGFLLTLLPGTLQIPFVGAVPRAPIDSLAEIELPVNYNDQTKNLRAESKVGIENATAAEKRDVSVALGKSNQNDGSLVNNPTAKSGTSTMDSASESMARPVSDASTVAMTRPTLNTNLVGEKRRGYVFRLFMNLSHLSRYSEPIADKIRLLGGKKAGDVPLGWKRGQGSYYHFTIPEDKMDDLLAQLKSYGPVKLSKDPHPRVMPQGEARLILWIESLDGKKIDTSSVNKSENSAETTTEEVHEVPLDTTHSETQE